MKRTVNMSIALLAVVGLSTQGTVGQAFDEERMTRDIAVAENVLATLIKQELEQARTFIGLDVKGSYQPGYGVTFRVPSDHFAPFVISITAPDVNGATIISDGNSFHYSYRTNGPYPTDGVPDAPAPPDPPDRAISLSDRVRERKADREDSSRVAFNQRIIRAAQNFILDYSDLISQLRPEEKIVVTNQSDRVHFPFRGGGRSRIIVEGLRADVTAFTQGKLSREQALKKLHIVNTEALDVREPDLEMLSSIFSRLYRPDLSKTYFTEGNVYYERLRDFGAVYYMRVVSSNETAPNRYFMPTVGLDNLDQAARDKKVTELYPVFEQDVKENMLEYGRTVRSLKDDENLVFNISLTRCTGCGIPGTLELSLKASVLRDFGAGKIDKNTAMSRIQVKKGQSQ